MMIADAQVHIWGPDTPERPWPKDRVTHPQRPVPYSADDLLRDMNEAGVNRAILVPPSVEGDRNDLALAAAHAHPDRFAVMGRLPLKVPPGPEVIAAWRDEPGMLGVRLTFQLDYEIRPLTGQDHDWMWSAAERAGVPFMLYPVGYLADVGRLADRFPRLKIVVDHMGVRRKGHDTFADMPELIALASRPNIAVKLSAMPFFSKESYPFRDVHEPIRRAFDAFGPQRSFWGTDFTRMPCSYRQCITMFTEEMPWLSEADKEWVMGRALCEWLGWPVG